MANIRAIGLMTAAMAFFALADLMIKFATRTLVASEVLFFMALWGTILFALLTRHSGQQIWSPIFSTVLF